MPECRLGRTALPNLLTSRGREYRRRPAGATYRLLPRLPHQWYDVAMWHARLRWDRERLAKLAAAALVSSMPTDAAFGQIEWRAPPCLYSTTTSAGKLCVRAGSFNRDICTALAHFAGENDLPPDFFARLIWRESRFRPDAVSPKGAEGIAQFIPSTARLRGLSNSF